MSEHRTLLGIYLNDHLAGATGGVELFRRAAGSAQGAVKDELLRLTAEVEQDRDALLAVMRALGVPVRHYKVAAGWLLEKAGRLKSNGHLVSRSPLSDLVELEGLVLGVQGKAAGFRAVRRAAERDATIAGQLTHIDLAQLVERAERQFEVLERLRQKAAERALTAAAWAT